MRFTEGERKVVFNPEKNKFEVRVFKGTSVLGTLASFTREQDALLDASAPDLYEMCKEMVGELKIHATKWDLGMLEMIDRANKAIAKVEGA